MKFLAMAALTMGLALTGAMMSSCSNKDIPVADSEIPEADNDGNPPLPKGRTVDLSELSEDYVAQDGDMLTSPLKEKYKISIAQGATVTLSNVYIDGGITCLGDATIILADDMNNTVNGLDEGQPGIQAGGMGTTLTIRGEKNSTGKLSATGGIGAAGIGSRAEGSCGYITIVGGVIEATGGEYAAGIGSGKYGRCDDITIVGGNITATGGEYSAGIGSGYSGKCSNIDISEPATGTAKGGKESQWDIGPGEGGTYGRISVEDETIGGRWFGDPDYNGGGDKPIDDPNGGDSPASDDGPAGT